MRSQRFQNIFDKLAARVANLLCLLTGFALLSRHFEKSRLPAT